MIQFICLIIMCITPGFSEENPQLELQSFYDFHAQDIEGNIISMNDFKGKKVLVVNVASRCGYTPQYEGLQKLYETYGDNLIVLGFPSNDFCGRNREAILKLKNSVKLIMV